MKQESLYAIIVCSLLTLGCGDDDDGMTQTDSSMDSSGTRAKISLSWRVTDGTNEVGCAGVGATLVSVVAIPVGGGGAQIDTFPCDSGQGESPLGFLPGEYNLSIELRSPLGMMGDAVTLPDTSLKAGETFSIGSATFDIVPNGTFSFEFALQGASTATCSGNGGPALQVSMNFSDSAETQCLPLELSIAGNTESLTCPSGDMIVPTQLTTCYEPTQSFISASLAAGSYRIGISATKMTMAGEKTCYLGDWPFFVHGDDQQNDLEELLVPADLLDMDCQ